MTWQLSIRLSLDRCPSDTGESYDAKSTWKTRIGCNYVEGHAILTRFNNPKTLKKMLRGTEFFGSVPFQSPASQL